MSVKYTADEQLPNPSMSPSGLLSKSVPPMAIELANVGVSKVKSDASSTRPRWLYLIQIEQIDNILLGIWLTARNDGQPFLSTAFGS